MFVDDLECAGNETALLECQHSPLALHNCMHHEDVGVLCTVPPPSGISSQLGLFLGGGGGGGGMFWCVTCYTRIEKINNLALTSDLSDG